MSDAATVRDADLSIAAVAARLVAWGLWARSSGIPGYATIEAAIVEMGGELISGSGTHVEPYCPDEMEIDAILAGMPNDLEAERRALITRYMRPDLPLEVLSRHYMHPPCSVATMKNRIRSGHAWVLASIKANSLQASR